MAATTTTSSSSTPAGAATYLCLLTIDLVRYNPTDPVNCRQHGQSNITPLCNGHQGLAASPPTLGPENGTGRGQPAGFVAVLPLPQQPLPRFLAAQVSVQAMVDLALARD